MEKDYEHTILIVGAGFAGIRTAQNLAAKRLPKTRIILLSNKHHFEYYPALYRVVTGRSPLEVCIPLTSIFPDNKVEIVIDQAESFSFEEKKVQGKSGSVYKYDYLVLGLGSETFFYNIPGLEENSFGFKSINEALHLKKHLHSLFDSHLALSKETLASHYRIVIVGGGPSGVELSAELAVYARKLAKQHGFDPSIVSITLIEGALRLLPLMPPAASVVATRRLRKLGVTVLMNETVTEEKNDTLTTKDATIGTTTVIWTSGVKPNHLYNTSGFETEKNNRVAITETLEAKGKPEVFIIGDAANTLYSGLAQTALVDGEYVAKVISHKIGNRSVSPYHPHKVRYCIPVGPRWAILVIGPFCFHGFIPWIVRQYIDFSFFLSVLPPISAVRAFLDGVKVTETCPTCSEASAKYQF